MLNPSGPLLIIINFSLVLNIIPIAMKIFLEICFKDFFKNHDEDSLKNLS